MPNFIHWLKQDDKSDKTITAYSSNVKAFQIWLSQRTDEEFSPLNVSMADVQDWKQYLLTTAKNKQGGRLSPKTLNLYLESLKAYFRYLENEGTIKVNPVAKVKKQKIQQASTPRWLDRNEVNRLLRHIEEFIEKKKWDGIRNRAIIFLMLYAGLRVSEVVNLELNDLNFEKRFVIIQSGKGGKYRRIEMNTDLRKALLGWLEIRSEKPTNDETDRVFTTQMRVPISIQGIEQVFKKIKQVINVEDFTPHVLRHTFCHAMLEKGHSLAVVADIAGHSDINVTRLYVRSSTDERRSAVESLSGER
ncbi:tyrosine-type recombinase/integrase [Patescibacteria group bacterium]|nr:tyrosine-type recombinase/integrase [Patescibacteria group bacterium]